MAFFSYQMIQSSPENVMYQWLEHMIDTGFRVMGSSNGLTYENYGQTSGTTGTGSGGGYHVITGAGQLIAATAGVGAPWIRLATPEDATHYREWCIQVKYISSVTATEWRIEVSRDGTGFDSGGSKNYMPVAADGLAFGHERPVRATHADDYSNIFSSTNYDTCFAWTIGDADENYDWFVWSWPIRTAAALYSGWGCVKVTLPFPGNGADTDPFVYIYFWEAAYGTPSYATTNVLTRFAAGSDTKQEGLATSAQVGCFSSFHYGEVDQGTYQVGFSKQVSYDTGTTTSLIDEIGQLTAADVSYHGPSVVMKNNTSRTTNFIKGYYGGALLKQGYNTLTQPHLVKDADTGVWYANFCGQLIAWATRRGILA